MSHAHDVRAIREAADGIAAAVGAASHDAHGATLAEAARIRDRNEAAQREHLAGVAAAAEAERVAVAEKVRAQHDQYGAPVLRG